MTTTMTMMRKNEELCVTALNWPFLNGLWVFFFVRACLFIPCTGPFFYSFGINIRNRSDLFVQFNSEMIFGTRNCQLAHCFFELVLCKSYK